MSPPRGHVHGSSCSQQHLDTAGEEASMRYVSITWITHSHSRVGPKSAKTLFHRIYPSVSVYPKMSDFYFLFLKTEAKIEVQ